MKRFSKLLLVLLTPFILASCSSNEKPEDETYEVWRVSDKAYDYNNDRKITEADFEIYKEFNTWLKSDEAIDLNGDHVITYEDYLLYKQGGQSFEAWKNSGNAFDYDKDGTISSNDFTYYLIFKDDIGKYTVGDIQVNGTVNDIVLEQSKIQFRTFIQIISRADFEIRRDNKLIITIQPQDLPILGQDYTELMNLLDQIKFVKKTETLAEIKAVAKVEGIQAEMAFYLEKDTLDANNIKYRSTFNFSLDFGNDPVTAMGNFSVVKVNA